tara:strand:- start:256 stop:384 length:129 start_codon:yes stop_codon:yes gene_type:complete
VDILLLEALLMHQVEVEVAPVALVIQETLLDQVQVELENHIV